jgi:molybdopterin biosynthesis enzyme
MLKVTVPSKGQKAGILTNLADAQGLVRIPAQTERKQGDLVEVYLINGLNGMGRGV